jgi:predicted RNase H-like HicB family nuclease
LIDEIEPCYGEIPDLSGVYDTGKTLEEWGKNLMEVVDGWLIIRLRSGMSIPLIQGIRIPNVQKSTGSGSKGKYTKAQKKYSLDMSPVGSFSYNEDESCYQQEVRDDDPGYRSGIGAK